MKPCPTCGGVMRRHSRTFIKSTGEVKFRLRCKSCGAWESHYYQPAGDKVIQKRLGGRPGYAD
jgi:ribosomal protein S27AE